MQLLDVTAKLPELRRAAGVRTWHVKDRTGWHDVYDERIAQVSCLQHELS